MNCLKTILLGLLISSAFGCNNEAVQNKVEQTNRQVELATSSATAPTQTELDAAKDVCDDAKTPEEAEKCWEGEYQRVNAEMERIYAAVMQKLQTQTAGKDKTEKAKANVEESKQAQTAWLNYREVHCNADENLFWREANGKAVELECYQRLTEQRSEELKTVYLSD